MNKEEVLKFYKFLRHNKETEIRVCDPKKEKLPISIFCKNADEFIAGCEKYNGQWNVYVGINERKEGGKSDDDVEFITNIGHDIDAHGEDSNFQKAQEIALKIKDDCIKLGYDEPLIVCSGRGFWVIHHTSPIENNEENRKKIKEFGRRIGEKYAAEGIDMDSSVYNISRIARVPGTLNVSDETNKVYAFIVNSPELKEDFKLAESILDIELKTYPTISSGTNPNDSCSFMDYCLSHEVPKGERHKVISRNMSLYIAEHPDRELLKEQYFKIQKGSENELNQWLKNADENGVDKYPFSCGELINFQKNWKIPLKCKGCKKYKEYQKQIKENKRIEKINTIQDKTDYSNLQKEIMTQLLLKEKNKATEIIVNFIEENNHIYTTKDDIKSEIWIYRDGIYIPQGKSEIEKQVRELLGEVFSINLSNEVLHKIKADTQIELEDFFKTNYIDEVPVKNGILNIFTRELKDFDPKKIFFNKIPIEYNPEAKCPSILKFFKDVLKDESDVPVILELFGFAMLKEYRFEKAFMFVGHGRNGKSKTIELLKRMLGIDNCCSVPLSELTSDSTSVCELFGKMVNLAGDLSNDSLKKTGMFKQTVGRDLIAAKRKYLRDLPFVNYAKHIFACNELPRVYDLSDGFWTKWVLLEFPYKFIPKNEYDSLEEKGNHKILDPDIIEKITTEEEMSGLLNISLDNLHNLINNKDFSYSIGTSDIKDFWIRQSDSFAAFCIDNLEEDYDGKITKKDLRKRFNKYCKKHKIRGSSDKGIKATLEDRYGVVEGQDSFTKVRFWEGIKFKDKK